jgi:hypothetical protein
MVLQGTLYLDFQRESWNSAVGWKISNGVWINWPGNLSLLLLRSIVSSLPSDSTFATVWAFCWLIFSAKSLHWLWKSCSLHFGIRSKWWKNATSTGQARSIRRSMMNFEPEHPNMVLLKSFKNMSKPYTWSILRTIFGHFFFKLLFVNCKSFCGCIDLPISTP